MESLTRFKRHSSIPGPRRQPRTLAAAAAPPSVAAPSITAPDLNYPSPGPTVLSYTWTQLLAMDATLQTATTTAEAAVIRAGDTMTGDLVVDANLGLNVASPPQRFCALQGNVRTSFHDTSQVKSGGKGWIINKTDKTDAVHSTVWTWQVGGASTWEIGQDVSTNNALNGGTGNSNFVLLYDHTAGVNDDGTQANTGADIFRISAAEQAPVGEFGPKFNFAFKAGPPENFAEFATFSAGKGMGGLRVSTFADTSRVHLNLTTRNATDNHVVTSWSNANDGAALWLIGVDIGAAGRTNWDWYFRDVKTTSVRKDRLFVKGTNELAGRVGLSTVLPMATLHLVSDNSAAAYGAIQTHFLASFTDTGDHVSLENRAINLQTILDASTAKNYFWMSGNLGLSSTVATPVATSSIASAMGLETTDSAFSVVLAPFGNNQTITRPLSVAAATGDVTIAQNLFVNVLAHTGATLGLYNQPAVVRQNITGSRASGAALADLITKLASTGLISDSTVA